MTRVIVLACPPLHFWLRLPTHHPLHIPDRLVWWGEDVSKCTLFKPQLVTRAGQPKLKPEGKPVQPAPLSLHLCVVLCLYAGVLASDPQAAHLNRVHNTVCFPVRCRHKHLRAYLADARTVQFDVFHLPLAGVLVALFSSPSLSLIPLFLLFPASRTSHKCARTLTHTRAHILCTGSASLGDLAAESRKGASTVPPKQTPLGVALLDAPLLLRRKELDLKTVLPVLKVSLLYPQRWYCAEQARS